MDHNNHPNVAVIAALKTVALAALTALAAPLAQAQERTMTVEQAAVQSVSVPASDLKLSLWADHANGVYADGEKARVFLKVNETARVELLDVGSTGVKTVLFPNACQPDNLIPAGKVVEVGIGGSCTGIRVGAPYGLSVLKATATTGSTTVLSGKTTRSAGPFSEYAGSAEDYQRGMTVIISQAPQAKWATASLNYSVVPAVTAAAAASTQVIVNDPASSTTVQIVTTPGSSATVTTQASAEAFELPPIASDFGMMLSTGEPSYAVGETLSFSVSAEKRCDLHVVNIDQNGDYTILYPNSQVERLTLDAGQTAFLPGSGSEIQIQLAGTPGPQTLLAVCTQNKTFWDSLLGRSGANARAAIAAVKPTVTLEQLLSAKGDGLVGRKAVRYQLTP